jgi:hypothetical protein
MSRPLDTLLRDARVWRAGRRTGGPKGIASGYPQFDRHLATEGWPAAALTEILVERPGVGELKLLMPALSALSQPRNDGEHRWLMWIAPPHIPYAPALSEAGVDLNRVMIVHANDRMDVLWAAEQSLRSGNCAAVLAWVPRAQDKALRRLQLAAAQGDSFGVVFRPVRGAAQSSPAALRLMLTHDQQQRTLHILKNRGGRPATLNADFLAP